MASDAVVDIFDAPQFASLDSFAGGFGFWAAEDDGAKPAQRQWWPSAEHYFQAGKFADAELKRQVRIAEEPGIAKHLGRTLSPLRSDWDDIKKARIRRAILEKLWSHKGPRDILLSIPAQTKIVNGNPQDPYFGIGRDGSGANVTGSVLQELHSFFQLYPVRRQLIIKLVDVGEPLEPFTVFADVTGLTPSAVAATAATALGVAVDAVEEVVFKTDGGFESTSPDAIGATAAELETFLDRNAQDCLLEVRLADVAPITLWNGTDDSYLARGDLRLMLPNCEALKKRLEQLMPLLRHAAFSPGFSFSINDSEPQPVVESSFAAMLNAATEGEDVVVSGTYVVPSEPQPSFIPKPAYEGGSALQSITGLDKKELIDKVKGLVWGAALGDAVGLATEFMQKNEAAEKYPNPAQLSPSHRVEDKHRSRWALGDWTDDTDQLLMLLDAIVAGGGILDQNHFGSSLKRWKSEGFPELGDKCGLGIGQTVNAVLEHVAYDVAPHIAADAEWRQSGCSMAANGAVMRCAASALGQFWDDEVLAYNAAAGAAITHADPRCIASCVAVAILASRCLTGVTGLDDTERRYEEVISACSSATPWLDGGDADELSRYMCLGRDDLAGLELATGGIGYTYKSLGAACWAFIHGDDFKQPIIAITMEAGDADSNAAVAGALLGVRLGYSQLPQDWLNLIPPLQKQWLQEKINACLLSLL